MEKMQKLQALESKTNSFIVSTKQDEFAIETIKDAIAAAKSGTFGVGAILVDTETGEVKYRGKNKVFSHSRSDLHAEMDVLNVFEDENGAESRELIKQYTLYTSLESCPMCLCRIITAGVQEVYHIADDFGGGMVHLFDQLPPVWQDIAKSRTYKKANCSEELSAIAEEVFLLTVALDDELKR